MRVIIRGNWANYVGTDYCDALGVYDKLDDAWDDAATYAWDRFEGDDEDYDEEGEYHGEGPDYYIEEYDPKVHDGHRAGGGSFADEFERMEK
jgi:hypothetical protein